jgi:hypothetical protein
VAAAEGGARGSGYGGWGFLLLFCSSGGAVIWGLRDGYDGCRGYCGC